MAKLVGSYKFVVAGVDVGKNAKGNNLLKLSLSFTDEIFNGNPVPLDAQPTVIWFGSLNPTAGKSGKSPAQITVEQLRKALDFKGGFNDLHTLMFAQGIAVCEDDPESKYTRIKYLNNVNGTAKNQNGALVEFSSDVVSDLESIFNSIS